MYREEFYIHGESESDDLFSALPLDFFLLDWTLSEVGREFKKSNNKKQLKRRGNQPSLMEWKVSRGNPIKRTLDSALTFELQQTNH